MEYPKSLRVMSIILIVLGIIRLVAGLIGMFITREFIDQNGLFLQVILENFVTGFLVLVSGFLLLQGKDVGRILFVAAFLISWCSAFIISGSWGIGTIVVFGILIGILFFENNIRAYFEDEKI